MPTTQERINALVAWLLQTSGNGGAGPDRIDWKLVELGLADWEIFDPANYPNSKDAQWLDPGETLAILHEDASVLLGGIPRNPWKPIA